MNDRLPHEKAFMSAGTRSTGMHVPCRGALTGTDPMMAIGALWWPSHEAVWRRR